MVKEKTVQELKEMIEREENFLLIDVREPYEYAICNLNSTLIPMYDLPDNLDKIPHDKTVIIHCRSGARSERMVEYLQSAHNFNNLYNLKGGILAWANEIDNSLTTY